jgi:hypothetical protein
LRPDVLPLIAHSFTHPAAGAARKEGMFNPHERNIIMNAKQFAAITALSVVSVISAHADEADGSQ